MYRRATEKLLDWNIHQYDKDIINDSKVGDIFETTNIWEIDPCFNKIHSAWFLSLNEFRGELK